MFNLDSLIREDRKWTILPTVAGGELDHHYGVDKMFVWLTDAWKYDVHAQQRLKWRVQQQRERAKDSETT